MITKFSSEVIEQLNYYVYRLIDPRNGQTFYIGKGKGNRIFEHVRCAIDYFDGSDGISDSDPNKFKIIKEIIDEGLSVVHIIQRWNLSEKEAFEVEGALIDVYQGLSNLQTGHNSEYGVTNAELIERRLNCGIYNEPKDFKYMIIKVKKSRLNEILEQNPSVDYRYEATRYCWRIKPRSIQDYPFVFSVTDGIVKEIYKITRWVKIENSDRYAFEGMKASESIRNDFVGKRIPDIYCKKGMASPVLFSKN